MSEALVKSLPGVNILLMGPAGTGKTYSIGTMVDAGIEVFYLGLEPGIESLLAYWKDNGKEIPENVHWHTLDAPKASFTELIDAATKINTMQLDTLAKMQDPHRSKHNQFIKMLEALNDFPDDHSGQRFGCVDTWGPSRCLVVDGMAGLARAALALVVGGKPVKNQSDWGIAQDSVEKIVRMWTDHCKCHFVLIAHVEREQDAILGGVKLMVSTLGKALAPKLPPMFSDVILTERSGSNFTWNTGSAMADVKTRNLAIAEKLPADFRNIISKWKSRGGELK
jgi:hypothetical protein